jgi:hypothetical protein
MVEQTPVSTSVRPQADESYRPLAGLAIAGFVFGGGFALVVVVTSAVALIRGEPLTLAPWFYLLAIGGLALSLAARWQIAASEGTRAGAGLARWGLWLSILFGLGYGTYEFTTRLAVRRQAEDYLLDPDKGLFAQLKRPEGLQAAFRLSQRPDIRPGEDESVPEPLMDEFMRFENHNLVRFFHQAGPRAEVEVNSFRKVQYKEGGYWVELVLDIKTPDEIALFPITVRSQDNTGAEREWYVDWKRTPPHPMSGTVTDHGRAKHLARARSHELVEEWCQWLKDGEVKEVRKHTCRPRDWDEGGKAFDLGAVTNDAAREDIQKLFQLGLKKRPPFQYKLDCCKGDRSKPAVQAYYRVGPDGRLQILHEMQCRFTKDPEGRIPKFQCKVQVIAEQKGKRWCVAGWKILHFQDMTRIPRPGEGDMPGIQGGPAGRGGPP